MKWLTDIRRLAVDYVESLAVDDYNTFRYSSTGDIHPADGTWGLGNIVFAVKILHTADILHGIDSELIHKFAKNIKSFEDPIGYISDPHVSVSLTGKANSIIEKTRRAETRQAFAALSLLDHRPNMPFVHIPYTKQKITQFLNSLNWSQPWDAGSHFSHLLFFLHSNALMFNYRNEETTELILHAIDYIRDIQSPIDGSWYRGENVTLSEKINGAMKIITGFKACNHNDIPNANLLIDLALKAANDDEACSNFNVVYILWSCTRLLHDYRTSEICDFLYKRLAIYREYYFPNLGGFSFYKHKSNTHYYGMPITHGKNEPDIHGTLLFLEGISLIEEMIPLHTGLVITPH